MSEDETGLHGRESHPARRTRHFRRIISAREAIADAGRELQTAVAAAREAGDSWAVIGTALDSTPESAFEQFGKAEQETAAADERQ